MDGVYKANLLSLKQKIAPNRYQTIYRFADAKTQHSDGHIACSGCIL